MIITISGKPGSGKSVLAKLLAKRLGYKHFSTGDFKGKIAMERGMTIDELNEIGKKEFWTDKKVDDELVRIGREDNFVIDTLMGFYFIPNSIKIFFEVDPEVGAERVFKNQRPDEQEKKTVEEVEKMLKKRAEESDARYKKYYKKSFLDKSNYDLIIDTTNLTIEQMLDRIIDFIEKEN